MIIAESDFNIFSTSRTGAKGLGQLMPATAEGLGIRDPYDPEQNIYAAARILRGHLDKYGGAPPGAGVIPKESAQVGDGRLQRRGPGARERSTTVFRPTAKPSATSSASPTSTSRCAAVRLHQNP